MISDIGVEVHLPPTEGTRVEVPPKILLPGDRHSSPFPALRFTEEKDLERRLLRIYDPEGAKWPDYHELPESFDAGGIEEYANWLQELTAHDPEHRERVSHVYLHGEDLYDTGIAKGLIYRRRVRRGENKRVNPKPVHRNERFIPIVTAHSHPHTSCFSLDDFKYFTSAYANPDFSKYEGPVFIVSTPEYNYLLMQSLDTSKIPPYEIISTISEHENSLKDMAIEVLDEGYYRHKSASRSREREREVLGCSALDYVGFIVLSHSLARELRLGLYYSHKDGHYKRVDKQFIKTAARRVRLLDRESKQ